MTRRFIRYLATTDDRYPIGALALEYLKGLLRIAPVRLGSMTGGLSGRWEAYAQLLVTPMEGDFVNVVCCEPSRWTWEQEVPMPKRLKNGELVLSDEVASGRQELYTQGVHNVLLTNERFEHRLSREQICSALRYEMVVVPDELTRNLWDNFRATAVRLITVPLINHTALRTAILLGAGPPPRS